MLAGQTQRFDLDPHAKILGMMNKQGSSNAAFHLRQHFIYNKMTKQSNGKIFFKKSAVSVGCPYVRSKSTLSQTQGQVLVNRELTVKQALSRQPTGSG